jgi:hypothetical protein
MSTGTMQVYWLELRGDNVYKAEAGQFVHLHDGDDVLRGFIAEVDHKEERLLIYLFSPVPVQDFATVVHEQIEEKVWTEKLDSLFRANPKLKEQWRLALTTAYRPGPPPSCRPNPPYPRRPA